MDHVRSTLGVSERRACRLLRQPRSTQRYAPRTREDEAYLVQRTIELATAFGWHGYRPVTSLLQREGWEVGTTRIERIWRQEGLKVPQKQPKRGRLWLNDGSCVRKRAEHRDHVWSYDFVHDATHDGRSLRMLTVMDEHTRECLSVDVARRMGSQQVLERLAELFASRGLPKYIRSDNGAEFTATAVRRWLSRMNVKTLYITPGSPWENGFIERLNGTLRYELLNREIFTSLKEAQVLVERWRVAYNTIRPHSSLGGLPPAPEAWQVKPMETPILRVANG